MPSFSISCTSSLVVLRTVGSRPHVLADDDGGVWRAWQKPPGTGGTGYQSAGNHSKHDEQDGRDDDDD